MSKTKISKLILGDTIRYTVEKKFHWWERWHYIMDGRYPRLFTKEELIKFGISHE
jgi:hypothetical protein